MHRRSFLAALSALIPFPAHAAKAKKIWVVGDSNAYLLMRHLKKLARQDGVDLRGNPVGGTSIIWWAKKGNLKLFWPLWAFHPDLVVVIMGANDALLGNYTIQHIPKSLTRMVKRLKRSKAKVLWVGPPPMPSKRGQEGAEKVREMIRTEGVPLLDTRQCNPPMWFQDVHPTVKGQEKWAKWIWSNLP